MGDLTEIEFKVLSIFNQFRTGVTESNILSVLNIDFRIVRVNRREIESAIDKLKVSGLISDMGNGTGFYKIENKGIVHHKYVSEIKDREDNKQRLQDKKLEYDVKNAERIYRTYGTTRAITWITFFVMLILGFLKIAESAHIWPYHK